MRRTPRPASPASSHSPRSRTTARSTPSAGCARSRARSGFRSRVTAATRRTSMPSCARSCSVTASTRSRRPSCSSRRSSTRSNAWTASCRTPTCRRGPRSARSRRAPRRSWRGWAIPACSASTRWGYDRSGMSRPRTSTCSRASAASCRSNATSPIRTRSVRASTSR